MPKLSEAQRVRQGHRERRSGRYERESPCEVCGRSAGVNYCSDRRLDGIDSAGNDWGGIGLVLCKRDAAKLTDMPDDQAFALLTGRDAAGKP